MSYEISKIGDIAEQIRSEPVRYSNVLDVCNQLDKYDIVESSVFGGNPSTKKEVEYYITVILANHFPNMSEFVMSDIANLVYEEKWTLERLKYAVKKIKMECTYPTFQTARFMQIDKRITFGRSEIALRRKLKFSITQSEIVVVKIVRKYTDENNEEKEDWIRAYAYKEEAENIMPNRIIGRWNEDKKEFVFTDCLFYDHTIEPRKLAFKKSLYRYCNVAPYNGKYSTDVVREFYEKFSRVIPPGDKMLFETFMSFDLDSRLDSFNNKILNK